MTEQEILGLIKNDKWMMGVINTAASLNLPDWIIGAGFVRNKVWNYLSGISKEKVDTNDVDLVYYDQNGNDKEADKKLSEKLTSETGINWEIKNEVYMHERNNLPPYKSTVDAISQWPETVTAIGVTLDNNQLKLITPYGIEDLVNFIVRPTPVFSEKMETIKQRVNDKKWLEKWPQIKIVQ
jgi:hypothetical protein